MQNKINKNKLRPSLLIISILLSTISASSYSDTLSKAIVKLYANGKVVDEWEAINQGHMDGPCFVFNVKKGIHTPQVRVCGTFSVEEKR